jgi:hypothetical protein
VKDAVQHVYKEIQEFDEFDDRNARDVSRDRQTKKETSKGSIRLEHLGDKENVTKKENIKLDLLRGRGEGGKGGKKALDATEEISWKKTAGSPIQAKKQKPKKINKIKVLKLVDFYEKMEEKKLRRQSTSISNPVEDINVHVGRKQAVLNNILENIQPVKQTLYGDTDLGGAGGETLENLSGPQQ